MKQSSMNRYLQLSTVLHQAAAETLSDGLTEAGSLSVTIENASDVELFDEALPGDPRWAQQKITSLFSDDLDKDTLLRQIEVFLLSRNLPLPEFEISYIEDQEWERSWLDQFEPIKVSEHLWICPSWCQPPDPSGVNLILDPGLAFGTGSHETTWLCLQEINRLATDGELNDKTILDLGCGSGILAIAAARLSNAQVAAVDVDPKAVSASLENVTRNNVQDQVSCLHTDHFEANEYDIVIANILANTIIDKSDYIKSLCRSEGIIILSGILAIQAEWVTSEFSEFGFVTETKGDWVVLVGRRTSA